MCRLKLTISLLLNLLSINLAAGYKPCSDDEHLINEQFLQEIVGNMNMKADPCEDFYEYVCGNWTEESDLFGSFRKSVVSMLEKLKTKDNEEQTALNEAYKKAILFYDSCRNLRFYDYTKFLQLVDPAAQQKWPLYTKRTSKSWNFENFVWWKVLAKLQSYGLKVIFNIEMDYLWEKSNLKILTIAVNEDSLGNIINLSKSVLGAIGYNTSVKRKLLIWELQAFESKLQNVIDCKNDTTKEQTNKTNCSTEISDEIIESTESDNGTKLMSLSEFQTAFPGIDWQEYFDIQFQGTNIKLPENIKLIALPDVEVLQRVMQFLENTSKETIALYLMSHFLIYLSTPLPKIAVGSNEICAHLVQTSMPLAVAYLYEENYYGVIRTESDEVINNVFERLKEKLNELFEQNHLNLTTKEIEHLQRKNQKMRLSIGNLPENKTIEFLVDFYADVNISIEHNFYHNYLELLRHKTLLEYRALIAQYTNETNVFETLDYAGTSLESPWYSPWNNLITIGFPDLTFPTFHFESHNVFYGNLMFTLGHEMFHAFDTSSLKFDDNGQYNMLMENIGKKKSFQEGLKCLKQDVTAGMEERIADVSGLHLTVETFYNNFPIFVRNSSILPSPLSYRKLFFIQALQYFCRKVVDDYIDLSEDEHDPSDYRVIYLTANSREFLDEFKCTREMIPISSKQICRLW